MDRAKFEKDVKRLLKTGRRLELAMIAEVQPESIEEVKEILGDEEIPKFDMKYQPWYSEALTLLTQSLPTRVDDFVDYYKPRRVRKELTYENYTVSDYLKGIQVTRFGEVIVAKSAGVDRFRQQVRIIEGLSNRFESTLYDLNTVLQADLFDHEIEAAEELLKRGFTRAAGTLSGVVLESHLRSVCEHRQCTLRKRNPTISEFNDTLKQADIIDVATWRKIQYLADIRNTCSHSKDTEPTRDEVADLVQGVKNIIKNVL